MSEVPSDYSTAEGLTDDDRVTDEDRLRASSKKLVAAYKALARWEKDTRSGFSEFELSERVERLESELWYLEYCVANPDRARIAHEMWAALCMLINAHER